MRKALLIGDAAVATGFARMNHAYCDGLIAAGWDVSVLALNYTGDPHKYTYPIYPCYTVTGGDAFGMRRIPELIKKIRPDVVCVTNDPWNIPPYLKRVGNTPMVASLAVDGKNCRGAGLNGIAMAVFWTQFGLDEARLGGYSGPASVVPLGVDLRTFRPQDRKAARERIGLPKDVQDSYIVGVVGRNQPRKRLDLTLMYFAEWIKTHDREDVYLFLHVGPTGDAGYNLEQLGRYLQISNRMIIAEPEIGQGISPEGLARVYATFDCMLSTTQGEGWGLTHMEAMACGVPCILPDWAALGEWAKDASVLVPCSSVACTINGINAVGGIMDRERAVLALDKLYAWPEHRLAVSEAGRARAEEPRFNWEAVGAGFAEAVEQALALKVVPAEAMEEARA